MKILKCGDCKHAQYIDKVDFPINIVCARFEIQAMSYDICSYEHISYDKLAIMSIYVRYNTMKLKELLEVIYNGEDIFIFQWDTQMPLYIGQNLEYDDRLNLLADCKVLAISKGNGYIDIGVK